MFDYEYKGYFISSQNRKRSLTGRTGCKNFCHPTGGWETGETTPNVETLKLLSTFFNVSINTLLGSPRQLICQCCGMPLEDSITSKEPDGSFNEDYCMWCYADGIFKYTTKEQLIDFCVTHMATESWPAEQVRAHMEAIVPTLKHWKK
mgnify:CR=1 FL=1